MSQFPKKEYFRLWNQRNRRLTPYVPGEQPRVKNLIKLNTNENPFPPAPGVEAVLHNFDAASLRLYPDRESTVLTNALAKRLNVRTTQLFFGNGSDELLAMAFQGFFPERSEHKGVLLMPEITYTFYPVYARLFDIETKEIPLEPDFSINPEPYCEPSGGVVITNPNAPTGLSMSVEDIERIVAADPDRLVLIDEAYVDFGGESAVYLVNKYDNVMVLHTFSKSRSMAGVRLGYAVAAEPLIEGLRRVRDSINSFTIDSIAQAVGCASVEDETYFQQTVSRIVEVREQTTQSLRELGFEVLSSDTNFILTTHPDFSGEKIYQHLRENNILVRFFNTPALCKFVRISIGLSEEMDALIDCLKNLIDEN
ncbi:MAG TPA: histidinol-phosphate transaminase [Clostridiaceae bacterium]|nr:histidinol-phosphate transaminase [Clostridiaceae bacterium]